MKKNQLVDTLWRLFWLWPPTQQPASRAWWLALFHLHHWCTSHKKSSKTRKVHQGKRRYYPAHLLLFRKNWLDHVKSGVNDSFVFEKTYHVLHNLHSPYLYDPVEKCFHFNCLQMLHQVKDALVMAQDLNVSKKGVSRVFLL